MKQFLSLLAGLVVPLFIYGLTAYALIMSTFTLASLTYDEKENIDALYFFSILILFAISLAYVYRGFKSQKKYTSWGILCAMIPLSIFLCLAGCRYFGDLLYHRAFDRQMAEKFGAKKNLIGLSRKEITDKLGYYKETARVDGQTLIYPAKDQWLFFIDLKMDTVIKAYLSEAGFDD